jgi:hypothetical protein
MELQAKLTALEEEVGILKVEIKSILQEVRVAVLARQNPFLADDSDRLVAASAASPAPPQTTPGQPVTLEALPVAAPANLRVLNLPAVSPITSPSEAPEEPTPDARRPLDLAALLDWLQETATAFSQPEMVMLLTIASYGGLVDDGLKDALIELSQQIARDPGTPASVSDFSLALQKLQAIRPATAAGQQRRNAA